MQVGLSGSALLDFTMIILFMAETRCKCGIRCETQRWRVFNPIYSEDTIFGFKTQKQVNLSVGAASSRDIRWSGHLVSRLEAAPTGIPKVE